MNNSLIWFVTFLAFLTSLFFLFRLTIRKISKLQKDNPAAPANENMSSGEPEIPKTNVTAEELGAQFVKWLQTEPPVLPLNIVPIDRYTTEFVYLQTFAFDLAAYLKLGDTYEKKVILDVFWDYITGAGVYTETFQLRMLRYTDAVKQATKETIHEVLGLAFAETCGAPGDTRIAKVGENTVQFIMNRIHQLFDHVTFEMAPGQIPSFEPAHL